MQVASLRVVEGIRSARRGRVVTRRLIGKGREGEGVGIEQRRRKPPWLCGCSRRWVLITKGILIQTLTSAVWLKLAIHAASKCAPRLRIGQIAGDLDQNSSNECRGFRLPSNRPRRHTPRPHWRLAPPHQRNRHEPDATRRQKEKKKREEKKKKEVHTFLVAERQRRGRDHRQLLWSLLPTKSFLQSRLGETAVGSWRADPRRAFASLS